MSAIDNMSAIKWIKDLLTQLDIDGLNEIRNHIEQMHVDVEPEAGNGGADTIITDDSNKTVTGGVEQSGTGEGTGEGTNYSDGRNNSDDDIARELDKVYLELAIVNNEVNRQIRDGVPLEYVHYSHFADYESAKKWVDSRSSFDPMHLRQMMYYAPRLEELGFRDELEGNLRNELNEDELNGLRNHIHQMHLDVGPEYGNGGTDTNNTDDSKYKSSK